MGESKRAGCGQLLLATVTWGSALTVSKAALAQVDAYYLTVLRYGFAALAFLLLLAWVEGAGAFRLNGRQHLRAVLLGTLGIPGGVLLAFIGLVHTRAEHAAVITGAQPMVAALLAWCWQRQRPARHTLCAMALALVGVALVVTRGDLGALAASSSIAGDLVILSGSVCWVGYTLGAAAFPDWSALRFTAVTVFYGALAAAAIAGATTLAGVAVWPAAPRLAAAGWEITYITIGSAWLGTLSWHSGIRRIGPDGVLFINFLPVTAFAIGVLQGARFNWAEVSGALMVGAALVVNHVLGRRAMRAHAV